MNLRACAIMMALLMVSTSTTAQVSGPRKVKDVKPIYPPESLEMGDEGVVIVELSIAASGQVSNSRILWSGCERLGKSAVAATREWRYERVRVNGKPMPFKVVAEVPFRLPTPRQAKPVRPDACGWTQPPRPIQ
jgi:TonB family protein